MNSPEYIFLDLGNVIVHFDHKKAVDQISSLSGIPAETVCSTLWSTDLQTQLERGTTDWPTACNLFREATGATSDNDQLARAASTIFEINHSMIPVIAGLQRSGCRLGILSNTCAPHWDFLLSSNYAVMPGRFDLIVCSHLVNLAKPDPAIFERAQQLAGVSADKIFFTDDIVTNVLAAQQAGWDAVPFTSAAALISALWHRGVRVGL